MPLHFTEFNFDIDGLTAIDEHGGVYNLPTTISNVEFEYNIDILGERTKKY